MRVRLVGANPGPLLYAEGDAEQRVGFAPNVLGVLGGMGPAATADFLLRLARLTPAARDQDHLPTIVYFDPLTPDRSDAILGRGPSPLQAMLHLTYLGATNPVMRGIRARKAGREAAARETLHAAAQQLVGRGAGALVLACTDVSAALAGVTSIDGTPVLDASDCLALASLDHLARPTR